MKKETKALYIYENHILSTYQTYLKNLENMLNEEKNEKNKNQAFKVNLFLCECFGFTVQYVLIFRCDREINAVTVYLCPLKWQAPQAK